MVKTFYTTASASYADSSVTSALKLIDAEINAWGSEHAQRIVNTSTSIAEFFGTIMYIVITVNYDPKSA